MMYDQQNEKYSYLLHSIHWIDDTRNRLFIVCPHNNRVFVIHVRAATRAFSESVDEFTLVDDGSGRKWGICYAIVISGR